MSPLVTVIIPTYNRSKCLKIAIESVLLQTFENFELLVIGDACTDDTAQVVSSFKDKRVSWYNLPVNSGYQSEPNNEGIRRAQGEYIAYLNHDDLWLQNHLEVLVEHIEKTDADFVFSILEWIRSFDKPKADIAILPHMPRTPEATAVLHKKSIMEQIGPWKGINETYSFPRVNLFRNVIYKKLKVEAIPRLTCLKFLWDETSYDEVGEQQQYLDQIKNDPNFSEKELGKMLANAQYELQKVPTRKRFKMQLLDIIRIFFNKIQVDPASLLFWQNPGRKIKVWKKSHHL